MAHSNFNFSLDHISSWADAPTIMEQDESISQEFTTENANFAKSQSSPDSLLQYAAMNGGSNFNIFILSSEAKSLPKKDPKLLQAEIKRKIPHFSNINSLRFTRTGSILISTHDVECASDVCGITEFFDMPVSTRIIYENITNRFLLFDMPVSTSLSDIARELESSNSVRVLELRRFVRRGLSPETSPILVTVLGTGLPQEVRLWFMVHRCRQFVDKPRQCRKCFKFNHAEAKCTAVNLCVTCGSTHEGACLTSPSCSNCQGNHRADFNQCPTRIKEIDFLSFKCRNFLSFTEARRKFSKNGNADSYAIKASAQKEKKDEVSALIEQRTNAILKIIVDRMDSFMLKLESTLMEKLCVLTKSIENLTVIMTDQFAKLNDSSPHKKKQRSTPKDVSESPG